jgi:hypothetical protein
LNSNFDIKVKVHIFRCDLGPPPTSMPAVGC